MSFKEEGWRLWQTRLDRADLCRLFAEKGGGEKGEEKREARSLSAKCSVTTWNERVSADVRSFHGS